MLRVIADQSESDRYNRIHISDFNSLNFVESVVYLLIQRGDRLYTSEFDVYRRQILTFIDYRYRAVRYLRHL